MAGETDEGHRQMLTVKLTRLREHRERNVLSQRDLAKKAKLNPLTVARLELGQNEARPRTAHRLATALGVTVHDLMAPPPVRMPTPGLRKVVGSVPR